MQQARMPYVVFETKPEAYKDENGVVNYKNVDYVTITPAGGKDTIYKNAQDWLNELKEKSYVRGPFDLNASHYTEWHEKFSKAYEAYRNGQNMVTDGTPLRACLAFTPAEIMQAESVRLRSLEDLAECNEEAISRMGAGARTLKLKAQKILESKQDSKLAEENSALRQKVDELETKINSLLEAKKKPKLEAA